MKVVRLSNGMECIVDDSDHEMLCMFIWHFKGTYAGSSKRPSHGELDTRIMHRMIMGLTAGDSRFIDHKNGNRLDNRKENLRVTDRCGNAQNAKLRVDNKSGMKGVVQTKSGFTAKIYSNNKEVYLGSFGTSAEAAHAYNKAAIQLHGEFARLNPVDGFVDQDTRLDKRNTTGYTGVQERNGTYTARIQRNGVSTLLGYFKDFESAKRARQMAE